MACDLYPVPRYTSGSPRPRLKLLLVLGSAFLVATVPVKSSSSVSREQHSGVKHLATVEDGIRMTRLASTFYLEGGSPRGHVAHFSPNDRRFAVVLMRGDVSQNTNEYSLYVFKTAKAFSVSAPQPALILGSSSNRAAIRDLKWLGDNETLAFLGERPGKLPQIYTFNTKTKTLRCLTHHSTPIVSYDITRDGQEILFYADPPPRDVLDAKGTARWGVDVTKQTLPELLGGACYGFVPTLLEGEQLFVKREGEAAKRIPTENLLLNTQPPSLSPDGRYALVKVFVRHVPHLWEGYKNRLIRSRVEATRMPGSASGLPQYMLLNVKTGHLSPLLNAPTLSHADGFAWAPDGESVVLSGTYLPLDVRDRAEAAARTRTQYVVQLSLPNGKLTTITTHKLKVIRWVRTTNTIVLQPVDTTSSSAWEAYRKGPSGWKRVPLKAAGLALSRPLYVALEENMNTPPKIYVFDPKDRRRKLLLDLNPQLAHLDLAKVEAVSWKATDGHEVLGGLYLPPNYVPGKRYPFVIQTHGFNPARFSFDGPWDSAFAAQPLAAKGFLVLQVGGSKNPRDDAKYTDTTQEAPRQMAAYLGAIRFLAERGMIDTSRVGIIGFSRTVYSVEYTLTHSRFRFRAATVADGIDAGYFSYIVFPNAEYEHLNGGPPFGPTLQLWLKNSPSFNLDKVRTPVRIEAYSPYTLLGAWEWFSGLTRLRKPTDLIYLPHGTHMLVRPWDRLASEQGDVDWFCFWLTGEDESNVTSREEYVRWHRLAELESRENTVAGSE